jgi:hypothetical protein
LDAWTDQNRGSGGEGCLDQGREPGGGHVCAQCWRDPPDGKEELFPVGRKLVWLHRECRRFYTAPADNSVSPRPRVR